MVSSKNSSEGFESSFVEDHKKYVEELLNSIDTGISPALTLNSHQCPFGVWYDNYKPTNNLVINHLKKIDEPHKRLHVIGAEVVKLLSSSRGDSEERLQALKQEVCERLAPELIGLLEKTLKIIKDSIREMVVILEFSGANIGLIVDEVHSVEVLSYLSKDMDLKSAYGSKYINSVAKSNKMDEMVLLVDERSIFDTFKASNVDVEAILEKQAEPVVEKTPPEVVPKN
ncbi:hypothetical protein tpqmel_0720 [Candidatus Gastranaerophilus sp. (ex Termes propinquus)]|nr:hypothetical protein tpqmel_0720 [Candidatus Gastranaerophilus sp. (ex Termes propinquus)]